MNHMRRLIKSPAINAICISVFTAFYALVFFIAENFSQINLDAQIGANAGAYTGANAGANIGANAGVNSFWQVWRGFLASGHQRYIAYILVAVTALIVALLLMRKRPYDEYHISVLIHCLVVAVVLTLAAIAIFYLAILSDPGGIIEKFTLFIVVHWTTVVFANLAFVLLCRWR